MRPCAVRWSFLEGLQRLVLPGRPSKAGPSWKAFKGWSFLEGLERLILPGRPSHPHFCFFFNIHFFFYSLDWRLPFFFFPEPDFFLLPSLSRRGCRRSEKGSGNMSLQRAKFSVFKVFEIACPPSWCQAKTRSEFAHSIGLDCQEPARCQRQNPCLPPATSSRVHPQDPQGVQVLVSPWQSLPAPARPSINA